MDKKSLSERDICTKFITPAICGAGWDEMSQIREEVSFTKGRIIVRGKLVSRGKGKRADYILYYKPNIPIALIEAKDNTHSVGDGIQQGLEYAKTLDIPFVFSSNGDGFVFHDRAGVIPGHALGSLTWKQGVSDLVDTIKIRHASGGWSTLGLKSYQQGRGSFEGTSLHGIWLDEEPPEDVYGECLIRTATTDGIVMLTFTPLAGMSEVVMGFLPNELDAQ